MTSEWDALRESDPARAEAVWHRAQGHVMVPHALQRPIVNSPARFRALAAGRRFGKTKLGARELVMAAVSKPNSMNWWLANSYKNVRRGYREVLRQLPKGALAKPAPPATANELVLHLKNGSLIEFYSGGNPDALAGEGVDFLIVDEAALVPEHVWTQLLRPTLMDSGGRALMISTPRGRNWFHDMYERGQSDDPRWKQYASWRFPSVANPLIDPSEIAEAEGSTPEIIFRQEYLAEFISDADSIFNLDDATFVTELSEPRGHIYMGVDLAKEQDFTVITAARESDGMPVYHDRFRHVKWTRQKAAIEDVYHRLLAKPAVTSVTIYVDSTGVGDPVQDDLEDAGLDVEGINFTNPLKDKMVRRLAADLERGDAVLLEHQRDEFEHYEYRLTPSGNFVYEAAAGYHDDEVAAKMLEHWARVQAGVGAMRILDLREEDEPAEEHVEVAPDDPADIMARDEVWV